MLFSSPCSVQDNLSGNGAGETERDLGGGNTAPGEDHDCKGSSEDKAQAAGGYAPQGLGLVSEAGSGTGEVRPLKNALLDLRAVLPLEYFML